MIRLCSLASGSKGNAHFLHLCQKKILIDCGISYKALKLRLGEIGEDVDSIDAVFVTHEHQDHTRGLKLLCKNHSVPVFTNYQTANALYKDFEYVFDFKVFTTDEGFEYEGIEIVPFSIQHDALDPVGFTFSKEHKVGVCTDIGVVTSTVEHHLHTCDYLVFEANHEPELVHSCQKRTHIYKERVLSPFGHLANQECAHFLKKMDRIKHVILAHLSQECNSVEYVEKAMEGLGMEYTIATQDKVSSIVTDAAKAKSI
ncbi:MAG: putative metallo-hydrolase YycJ [Chlamydiae bacterium]|nr:putative metallo-hydrolase YycJ [Chlamydiota bacterium]